ncbi:MAG: GNAT family N-acetyltransferase [Leptospirales bacterium]|jgi:acetyl CoA:N6-hydroxylysine acetyl transferase
MSALIEKSEDPNTTRTKIDESSGIFDNPVPTRQTTADLAARFVGCLAETAIYKEDYPIARRTFWTRPVNAEHDQELIHSWMNREHVVPYWKMDWPLAKIRRYLDEAIARPGFEPYIAYMDDEAFGYFESYDPARDRIHGHYESQETDVGLHILIGEEKYLKKFIIRLSITLMRVIFERWPACERIVGEPDEDNRAVLGLMKFLGFRFAHKIAFPEKTADLLTLTRIDFERGHGTRA